MIERRPLADGKIELTFRLAADHPATPLGVAGEFNGWDVTPFVAGDEGLEATVVVVAGRRYQFRYLTADERWFNDTDADDYTPNEFGGMNCVVDLTELVPGEDDQPS